MAAPTAKYLQDEMLTMYIKKAFKSPNPLQAKIDTICQKAYPDEEKNRTRTNVDVITKDNGELKKVVVLEAKRFPVKRAKEWYKNLGLNAWTKPLEQLQKYMLTARDKDKWVHMMYGIIAVGDRVRFFKMQPSSNTLEKYVSPDLFPQDQGVTSFSIREHSLLIETVLSGIADDVKSKRKLAGDGA